MLIKLRYRGQPHSPDDVQALTQEIEDICRANDWPFNLWNEDWSLPATISLEGSEAGLRFWGHAPLRGISFKPGDHAEMVWMTFMPDGLLQSLFTLDDPTFTGESVDFPWQRAKVDLNQSETHLALCKLFRYVSGKYFARFEVRDESGYWQHGDEARFTTWAAVVARSYNQWQDEMAAIQADETLDPDQKYAMLKRLTQEHKENFRLAGE